MFVVDFLTIMSTVVLSVTAAEALTLHFVHKNATFASLKRSVDRRTEKLAKLRSRAVPDLKAVAKEQDEMESEQKLLMGFNFRNMLFTTASMLITYNVLSGWYGGAKIGELPFEPMYLVRSVAQRGLPEPVGTHDFSYVFVLALTAMVARPLLEKAFGTEKPKGISLSDQMAKAQQ
jgi:uncharacterized membrane protein (DUF106 family)